MFWFDSSVRDAVDKVKSSGAFLLVLVQGDDSLSKKYENFLNEETKFGLDDCVAIKITNDSVAFQQFKQIYVSVPVPSVFLIQNNGIPFKVVSSDQLSDINSAITDAVKWQRIKQEKKKKNQTNGDAHFQVENKSSLEIPSKSSESVKNTSCKIFQITEEEVKKRLREIQGFPRFLLLGPHLTNELPSYCNSPFKHQSARIQFRLPNDTMPSWEFPNLSTLGDVRAYLMEKTKLSPNFRLLRTYPKSSFTPQDEEKTLAELSLTPSATLIVVPVEDKTVQARVKNLIVHQNFLSNLLGLLFRPLLNLLNYFKKHFFKMPNQNERETRRLPSDTAVEKILNKKTSTSNIHSLKLDEDTDTDAEHPDNGNSTQQKFPK